MPTKIIDVSKWQGKIDWKTAKSEVALAIIRVQDGSYFDPRCEENVKGCIENNIPYAVYGFFRASTSQQAIKEMDTFLQRIDKIKAKPLFVVIDVETVNNTKESIRAAVNYLLKHGIKVGVYFAHHLYPRFGGDYGQHFTWIPRYGKSSPKYPCDLWQYTSSGTVAGIRGNVDLNILTGTKTLAWFISGRKISKPKPPIRSIVYIVKSGDTLSHIAQKYKTTVSALVKLNKIKDKNLIFPGQKIRIP